MATLSIQVDAMPTPWVADPSEVKTTVTRDAAGNSIVNIDISTLPQNVRAPLQLAYSRVYIYRRTFIITVHFQSVQRTYEYVLISHAILN